MLCFPDLLLFLFIFFNSFCEVTHNIKVPKISKYNLKNKVNTPVTL